MKAPPYKCGIRVQNRYELATYRDIKVYVRYLDGMIVLHDGRTNEYFEINNLADLDEFVDESTAKTIKMALTKLPHDLILNKLYRA
jgi:hypothetical protein